MNRAQLVGNIFKKKSVLCVGLDTDITKLPKHLLTEADPVFAFNQGYYRRYAGIHRSLQDQYRVLRGAGPEGVESMEKTRACIPKDIFTIADAKRGDIGNTSEQYARTFFHTYPFDSVTVAPYMGEDSVKAILTI